MRQDDFEANARISYEDKEVSQIFERDSQNEGFAKMGEHFQPDSCYV
jgi:hypothetical protein